MAKRWLNLFSSVTQPTFAFTVKYCKTEHLLWDTHLSKGIGLDEVDETGGLFQPLQSCDSVIMLFIAQSVAQTDFSSSKNKERGQTCAFSTDGNLHTKPCVPLKSQQVTEEASGKPGGHYTQCRSWKVGLGQRNVDVYTLIWAYMCEHLQSRCAVVLGGSTSGHNKTWGLLLARRLHWGCVCSEIASAIFWLAFQPQSPALHAKHGRKCACVIAQLNVASIQQFFRGGSCSRCFPED